MVNNVKLPAGLDFFKPSYDHVSQKKALSKSCIE